jgi:exonuclease SbcC
MHISKVQLENIKSHVLSTFEFTRGTTAITGENGAGKTTIIEAIAWALFDLLEYKKEDFVRRGAKKGSVTVTFESGLDEREYVVYRDTGTGYHVLDPRLDTRVAVKKEEVFRFLWQHLGLEPGTDLKSLFKQAIGVPQGTFTAIFLEGAAERKAAFDRLLKVEEYRQAAEKLRETTRYLDAGIARVRETIARSEGELSRAEMVEQEHKEFQDLITALAANLERLLKELTELQLKVGEFDGREARTAELRKDFERRSAEKEKAELVLKQLTASVDRASEAVRQCSASKESYQRHLEVLGQLRELERERQERDGLRSRLVEVEGAITHVNADRKRVASELEAVEQAHSEIAALRPRIPEQEQLEREIAELRQRTAFVRSIEGQIDNVNKRLDQLRAAYKTSQERLKEAEAVASLAADLESLEKRDIELTRSIASLYAGLERDERFQGEIRNGLCPILSERCLNLGEGQTLEAFITSQFTEIRSQIEGAEAEHSKLSSSLKRARDAARQAAALGELRSRASELSEQGQGLRGELAELTAKREELSGLADQLAGAETRLRNLGDPRGRVELLQAGTGREMELRQSLTAADANLERLESDKRILAEQMESYRDLDARWTALSEERESTSHGHRIYLSNEAEAATLGQRQEQLGAAQTALEELSAQTTAAERELKSAEAAYDPAEHERVRKQLRETEKEQIRVSSEMKGAQRREQQLAAEISRFTELRLGMRTELQEKQRLERVAETTAFIRDTLKEAAPRVARNYVYHVSLEAAQMFREITGNAEYTLKWAEDYSIVMEEGGYERPFASLSGGEQMAAALSIRLALLKQLTDIRIAFFDEPTANMDAERRENLAMQISRITHFDQLFVISHDETFDNFVDNVISIERLAAA